MIHFLVETLITAAFWSLAIFILFRIFRFERKEPEIEGHLLGSLDPSGAPGPDPLQQIMQAIHDVDCPDGPSCEEVLTTEGRYGRYAAAALRALIYGNTVS